MGTASLILTRTLTVVASNQMLRQFGFALLFIGALSIDIRSGDSLHYVDESEYQQSARTLLHDGSLTDANGGSLVGRPPGYPAVIAVAYAIAERPLAGKIENAFLLLAAATVLAAIARRIQPRSFALVPYVIMAYPIILYASSLLYPQILGCLLLSISVLLFSTETLSSRQAIAAGLIWGVLCLAIPSFILLAPLVAAFVAFHHCQIRWTHIRLSLISMFATLLVILPWTIRNYVDFHKVILISTNGGKNLLIGNSSVTTPNSGRTVDVIAQCKRIHPGMNDYDVDTAMGKCAMDWILQNKGSAALLYVGKVVNYFNYRNEIATPNEASKFTDWVEFWTYYPILFIAILRLSRFRQDPLQRIEKIIYILYFANALVSAIFFTRLRFRIPFDFLLIAVVAAFLYSCWTKYAARAILPPNTTSLT